MFLFYHFVSLWSLIYSCFFYCYYTYVNSTQKQTQTLATIPTSNPLPPPPPQVYYNPGIEEDRAPSDRAESEFTVRNEAVINPQLDEEERRAASRAASEIYASTRMPRPQSEIR